MNNIKPILIAVKSPLPSLNRLLSMNHWQRMKLRHAIHDDIRSAWLALQQDRRTQTGLSPNTTLTRLDTAKSSTMIPLTTSNSPSPKKKSRTKTKNAH